MLGELLLRGDLREVLGEVLLREVGEGINVHELVSFVHYCMTKFK